MHGEALAFGTPFQHLMLVNRMGGRKNGRAIPILYSHPRASLGGLGKLKLNTKEMRLGRFHISSTDFTISTNLICVSIAFIHILFRMLVLFPLTPCAWASKGQISFEHAA